jgi:TubC N-terminal docking domain
MKAHPLLAELHRAGCQLSVVSGEIKIKGSRSVLTPGVLARLKACKAEIVSILQAPAATPDVNLPTVDTFEERTATLSEDGEILRNEAVTLAAKEYGFASHDEFCSAKIREWASRLTVIPPDLPSEILNLYMRTRLFLRQQHAFKAVTLGWDEISLFGVFPGKGMARRLDAQGLVSGIALAYRDYTILSIGNDAAMVRAVTGGPLRYPRFQSGAQYAVVWWEAINP